MRLPCRPKTLTEEVVVSPLLQRIEERLRTEQNQDLRAELVAQQATYLARVGKFSEARQRISDLRSVFGDGRNGRVTALIMLAEGVLLHYELLDPSSEDRVKRAQLLGQFIKDREIVAISSSWRAHLQFERSCYGDAAGSLRQALDNASEYDHAARLRCSIVLYNAFALCGDQKESQRWFMSGREHALALGDQAGIDALLHSRAAFGLAWLRVQRCTGDIGASAVATVRSDVASARNLQRLARIDAHATYIDLCIARLQILENRFESAIDLLSLVRNAGPYPTGHLNQNLVELEIAFCNAKLGRMELAAQSVDCLNGSSADALDIDDRLIATWMIRELSRMDKRFGAIEEAENRFDKVLSAYEGHIRALKQELQQFTDN